MKEEIRRAIAVNAAARINGNSPSSLYSYDRGQRTNITPNYDYEDSAHIGGSGSSLYHYGLGSHINLTVNGKNFEGYDNNEGHHFMGSVNGSTVQIYDYGEGQYFTYNV